MENTVNWSVSFLSENFIELPLHQEDKLCKWRKGPVSKLSVMGNYKESNIKLLLKENLFSKHVKKKLRLWN